MPTNICPWVALLVSALSLHAYGDGLRILSTPLASHFSPYATMPNTPELTDTQNQFNLFCHGVGADEVDILFTHHKITQADIADCQKNGVYEIIEMPIAYNALLLQTASLSVNFDLSQNDLYKAIRAYEYKQNQLIEPNTAISWAGVNNQYINAPIHFVQQAWHADYAQLFADYVFKNCQKPSDAELSDIIRTQQRFIQAYYAMFYPLMFQADSDLIKDFTIQQQDAQSQYCSALRADNYSISAIGQFNNLKASAFPADQQIFIMAFQQGDKNLLTLRLDGKVPTTETLKAHEYPLGYPIFLYIKMAHIGAKKGLKEYADALMGQSADDIIRHAQRAAYIAPIAADIDNARRAYKNYMGYIEKP
ncbi:MAG: substrate-binding domain-containing protein [Alphaproteobacteria bacterium]